MGSGPAPPAFGGGDGWAKGGALDGFSRSARRPTRARPSGMRPGRGAAACGVMLLRRWPRCWPRRRAARVGERGRSGPQRTVAGGRGARGGRFAPLPWIPGIAVWHGGLPAVCRWSSALSAYRQISGMRGRDVWAGRFARHPCSRPLLLRPRSPPALACPPPAPRPRPRSLQPRCPRSLLPRRRPLGPRPRSLLPRARVRCCPAARRRPPAARSHPQPSAPALAAARPPGPQTPLVAGGYPKIWSI